MKQQERQRESGHETGKAKRVPRNAGEESNHLAGPADDAVVVGAIVGLAQVVAALLGVQLLPPHAHCHWTQVLIRPKEVLVICTPGQHILHYSHSDIRQLYPLQTLCFGSFLFSFLTNQIS